MRLFFYIFIFSQLLNLLGVFAEKVKKDSIESNSVIWEKVQENKVNKLKKIIWKSYKDDGSYFQKINDDNSVINKPNEGDISLKPSNKKDKMINFGGITVSNAFIPKAGTSQINLNYDSKGNLFGFYGYSLSNIFQLEFLNIGRFNNIRLNENNNSKIYSNYLSENNLNYRLGGKLLIFSTPKNDFFWMTLRKSVGRNNDTNQGYLFSELINTFRLNDRIALNLAPKYFFSGVESFGGIGASSYINLFDNLQLIPEMNTLFNNNSHFNYSLALRYSFQQGKSLDLYYSKAEGIQDIGQILEDKEYRFGLKLNFLY